jgi:hypothetical protein
MADRTVKAFFEATWLVDQFVAKADILVRDGRGWRVLEVKSGIHPNPEYIEDLAYTVMVATRAGLKINSAALLLIDGNYRIGHDDTTLFAEHDVSELALKIAQEFDAEWDAVAGSALAPRQPSPELIFACRSCPFFRGQCHVTEETNHILDLPRLSQSAFNSLRRQNVTRISGIPPEARLTQTQERVRSAVKTGRPVISRRNLAEFLNGVDWPAFYLDFETVKSAIPIFPTVAPHEQVVTQYSLHVCTAPGARPVEGVSAPF